MSQKRLDCKQVNEMDLVELLAMLGHQPLKTTKFDYWYLSPFRDERTPSFKVNRQKNVWFDHGIGKGVAWLILDFDISTVRYRNCLKIW